MTKKYCASIEASLLAEILWESVLRDITQNRSQVQRYGQYWKEGLEEPESKYGVQTIRVKRNLEIYRNGKPMCLRPLTKALFLLYLKHPEGIGFKEIGEYRLELMGLYMRILGGVRSEQEASQTLDRLSDPFSNNLDTQRYILKRSLSSFMKNAELDECVISGTKGQKKRVLIDRARVIWEDWDETARLP